MLAVHLPNTLFMKMQSWSHCLYPHGVSFGILSRLLPQPIELICVPSPVLLWSIDISLLTHHELLLRKRNGSGVQTRECMSWDTIMCLVAITLLFYWVHWKWEGMRQDWGTDHLSNRIRRQYLCPLPIWFESQPLSLSNVPSLERTSQWLSMFCCCCGWFIACLCCQRVNSTASRRQFAHCPLITNTLSFALVAIDTQYHHHCNLL